MSPANKIHARRSAGWVRNAVIYEIYFRSFTREGTIQSAIRKLPSLRSLGVTVLWLMPIHPIGRISRKGTLGSPYAVKDYYKVNPEYGTLDDLIGFIRAAHKNGFRVIMDLVIGHAAWDNPLTLIHREWFRKDKQGAIASPKPEWSDVAAFDFRKEGLRKYMMNVMKFWIDEIGFDGFRCDVAESVPLSFWEEARRVLDKIKPVMMISESDNSPSHHRNAFDLSYSTPFYRTLVSILQGKSSASELQAVLKQERKRYPEGSMLLRFTSNHDRNAEDGSDISVFGKKGAKLAAVAINTLPGVPMLYNGQEFGLKKQLSLFEKTTLQAHNVKRFFRFYQKLFALRKKYRVFVEGKCLFLPTSRPDSTVAFARITERKKIIALLNCSERSQRFTVDCSLLANKIDGRIMCDELFTGRKFTAVVEKNRYAQCELSGFGSKLVKII